MMIRHKLKRHGRVVFNGKGEKRPQTRKEHRYICKRTGYVMFKEKEADKHVPEHRLIVEKNIGRKLTKNEVVHHINGLKDDNRIENLYLCVDNSENKNIDAQLLKLAFNLVSSGYIKFSKGKYYLNGQRNP